MFKLGFVIIGLVCNSLGCYWAPADLPEIADQIECAKAATDLKTKSAMYFDAACMVVAHKTVPSESQ